MTMSRKHFSRRLRRVGLLVGLAGLAVSTAGAAYAAPHTTDPADAGDTTGTASAAPYSSAGDTIGGAHFTGPAGPAGETAARLTAIAAESPAERQGYQAVSVSVERTRGRHDLSVFQVSGNIAAAGEVLRLASSPAFRTLRSHYVPADKSGRYRYEVTVRYRNGKAKRVVTYADHPGTPRVLLDVIRKVETLPTPAFPPGFPFTGGFPFN